MAASATISNRPNTAAGTETAAAAPSAHHGSDPAADSSASITPEVARARARLSVDSSGVLGQSGSASSSNDSSAVPLSSSVPSPAAEATTSSHVSHASSGSVGALPSEAALVASGIVPARPDSQADSTRSSTPSTAGSTAARLNALDQICEAQAQTLFPSPSGGFVPPPEMDAGQWKLKDAPVGTARSRAAAAGSALSSSEPAETINDSNEVASPDTPNRPPSLQPSLATASLIAGAPSASGTASGKSSQITSPQRSPALRPESSSSVALPSIGPSSMSGPSRHASRASISRTGGATERSSRASQADRPNSRDGQRQSLMGKHSDSPLRRSMGSIATSDRYSSTSAMGVPGIQPLPDESRTPTAAWPPLKIRDFAFPVTDPRHVGARDLSVAGERLSSGYAGGDNYVDDEEGEWHVEEEDEEEDEDEGAAASTGLPLGRYKAVYPFSAESAHELSVQTGDIVRVVGALEGGWAIADIVESADSTTGEDGAPRRGLVPEAYLEWFASDDQIGAETSASAASQPAPIQDAANGVSTSTDTVAVPS